MYHFHNPQTFRLQQPTGSNTCEITCDSKGLQLEAGKVIPWEKVTHVNLNQIIGSKYNVPHYLCRLSTAESTLQFKADLDRAEDGLEYKRFLGYIHHQLRHSNSQATFTKGMRNTWSYHLIRIGTLVAFLGLEVLFAFAIATRGKIGIGILFMLVTAVAGYWFYNLVRHSLQPKAYDPAEIPWDMMPPD
jgi:hypothetical protein